MKKDQNLPNKKIHSNNSSGKPLPNNSNYSRNQLSYRGRSAEQRNSRNFSQIRYSRSNSQHNQYRNNYSRSNVNRRKFSSATSSHSHPRIRHYSIDHEIHRTIEIETIQIIEIEAIQIIEINIIQITDQETTPKIEIIKDPIIYIQIDHETIHKTETQVITIYKEIIPNLLIGIVTVIQIPNTDIEAILQNIKDKLTKYKQLKEQLQDPLVSMIQKVLNYN